MATMTHPVHPDVLTLADLLLAEWPAARLRIRASGHPTCEGDDDAASDADDKSADDAKADATDDKADAKSDDADKDASSADDDWKARSRQNERRAKAEKKRADELAAKLAEREAADLSEQEKAIKAARDEATAEVTTKYEAQQRTDRIENAVTKLALKGFKAKDGDEEITLKFADPDDAQLRIDRALRNGDLDYDDIYADGKPQTDALTSFLTELLTEHPRLQAQEAGSNGGGKVVDFDGGKGKGAGAGKDLAEMSPDEHLKEIQGTRR